MNSKISLKKNKNTWGIFYQNTKVGYVYDVQGRKYVCLTDLEFSLSLDDLGHLYSLVENLENVSSIR